MSSLWTTSSLKVPFGSGRKDSEIECRLRIYTAGHPQSLVKKPYAFFYDLAHDYI